MSEQARGRHPSRSGGTEWRGRGEKLDREGLEVKDMKGGPMGWLPFSLSRQ